MKPSVKLQAAFVEKNEKELILLIFIFFRFYNYIRGNNTLAVYLLNRKLDILVSKSRFSAGDSGKVLEYKSAYRYRVGFNVVGVDIRELE